MSETTIPLLEQRRIEAGMLAQVYDTLCADQGPDAALRIIRATLERAAEAAGQAFAAKAQGGPCLKHFATVLDLWRGTGALDIEDVRLEGNELTFRVVGCRYAEAYRDMGLPEELVRTLSCVRDEPFARGYSDRLRLDRPETIAAGHPACGFRFIWG